MKKSIIISSAFNLIGLLLYIHFITRIVAFARMEQRDYYDFGDGLNYILTAVPVFLFCLLLNITWGVKALVAIFKRRDYSSAVACGMVVAVWTTTILIIRKTV